MQTRLLLVLGVCGSSLLAQNTVVSPVGVATVEGSGGNIFPFASTVQRRYMQLHSDLVGSPLPVTMLSFRLNAGTVNYTGVYTYDMELSMGHGRHANSPSFFFDANYIGPKTQVLPRGMVNFGPQGQNTTPGPNPFTSNMDLMLPAPFVYTGVNSLVWDVLMHGASLAGNFGAEDAEQGTTTTASSSITGTGCIATGQAGAMTHGLAMFDVNGTVVMNITVTAGPASTPCLLALGTSNPNLSIPGLCGPLLTDLAVLVPIGSTNASGAITTSMAGASTFTAANTLAGGTLFTQVHAPDPGRIDPIPVCNSNGRMVTAPSSNLTRVDLVTRIFNNAGGVTATEGIYFTTTVGYGLVTQFTHL